jgi:hypothetical protein
MLRTSIQPPETLAVSPGPNQDRWPASPSFSSAPTGPLGNPSETSRGSASGSAQGRFAALGRTLRCWVGAPRPGWAACRPAGTPIPRCWAACGRRGPLRPAACGFLIPTRSRPPILKTMPKVAAFTSEQAAAFAPERVAALLSEPVAGLTSDWVAGFDRNTHSGRPTAGGDPSPGRISTHDISNPRCLETQLLQASTSSPLAIAAARTWAPPLRGRRQRAQRRRDRPRDRRCPLRPSL